MKNQRALFGLMFLAVLLLTLVTLILTAMMLFNVIALVDFIVVFAAWYLVTAIFLFVARRMRINNAKEEAERDTEDGPVLRKEEDQP